MIMRAILDKTYENDQPMVYLHGHRQMIRGFEAAIKDAEVGEKRSLYGNACRGLWAAQCE